MPYRCSMHEVGSNSMQTATTNELQALAMCLGVSESDLLAGYRAFSMDFAKEMEG